MAELDQARRTSFDRNAEAYDAIRPSYPDAAIDDLLARSGIQPGGRVLEVGAGTGKATLPLARRGYALLALEPAARMAALLRRHVAAFPNVSIVETTFEAWSGADQSFDLVVSAQSFHWVRQDVRYAKAAAALRGGGAFAWLTNERRDLSPALQAGFDRAYARWFPTAEPRSPHGGEKSTLERVREIEANGSFEPATVHAFPWTATYTSRTYVALLDTYSDHAVQPADVRDGLYREIAQLIDEAGGAIALTYDTVVLFARRCTSPNPKG
jgi:SAM-dependent methyltransferase